MTLQAKDAPSPSGKLWACRDHHLVIGSVPLIMGVLNVTPDSFSDGGAYNSPSKAIAQALHMRAEGAHIIDIGGESSRPGATPVPPQEQISRVVPVIEGILANTPDAVISIDTTSAAVAAAAIAAGACIINDISGLTHDPDMPELALRTKAGLVIMHMQGTPGNMQDHPVYQDCVAEIHAWLQQRIETLTGIGIAPNAIAIDPGIGFGKKMCHNLEILHRLAHFSSLGVPVLVGASRKRFIGMIGNADDPQDRLPGSLAAVACATWNGAAILRVHDVAASLQAARIAAAIQEPARWKNV